MTLALKTSSKKHSIAGVSLLEVVVALFLMGLLMSFGLIAYNGKSSDETLRKAVIELESMSSRARSLAFLKQSPHRITLQSANTVVLEQPAGSGGGFSTLQRYDSDVMISLRRWGAKDDEWLTVTPAEDRAEPIYWYFAPTGLCEPVSIRLQQDESWVVLHMDPLTGRVQEEESYIK